MSTLQARLQATRQNNSAIAMYSVDGATFQEYALNLLDYKGSAAHKAIGGLVTAINNKQISVVDAKSQFIALLVK